MFQEWKFILQEKIKAAVQKESANWSFSINVMTLHFVKKKKKRFQNMKYEKDL